MSLPSSLKTAEEPTVPPLCCSEPGPSLTCPTQLGPSAEGQRHEAKPGLLAWPSALHCTATTTLQPQLPDHRVSLIFKNYLYKILNLYNIGKVSGTKLTPPHSTLTFRNRTFTETFKAPRGPPPQINPPLEETVIPNPVLSSPFFPW